MHAFRIEAVTFVLFVICVSITFAQPMIADQCTCGCGGTLPNCGCNGPCSISGPSSSPSGSGQASGGCYSDPRTGKITCVDTQGSPTESTGGETVQPSGRSSGTIIIDTSGGSSGGWVSAGYAPEEEPSVPTNLQGPSWYQDPVESGVKQTGYTLGAAGLGAAAVALTATAPVSAPVLAGGAAVGAATAAIAPIVDMAVEWVKKHLAEQEAQQNEEGAGFGTRFRK